MEYIKYFYELKQMDPLSYGSLSLKYERRKKSLCNNQNTLYIVMDYF